MSLHIRFSTVSLVFLFLSGPGCSCGTSTGKGSGSAGATGGGNGTGSANAGNNGGNNGCGLRTCSSVNAECGQIGDGCGSIIDCGTCNAGTCGGGGVPYQCGSPQTGSPDAGDAGPCVNLCQLQTACANEQGTTLTGTVHAGTDPDAGFGEPDPLPNALVYVPNAPVEPFPSTVTCDPCGAPVTGSPLVSTLTSTDGTFSLSGVPVVSGDGGIPLVIQLGRWRRQVMVPPVGACATEAVPDELTRMPRNQSEGDIPHIAMVTGNVDATECVLRKMGIDDGEFGIPGSGGRVDLYVDNGASDATGNAPTESALTGDPSALGQYDLVVFACHGKPITQSKQAQTNIINYANDGGRIYATHYSYVWLDNDPPFKGTADWATESGNQACTVPVEINTNFSGGAQMSSWMTDVGAALSPGVIPLGVLRNDFTDSVAPSETWVSWDGTVGNICDQYGGSACGNAGAGSGQGGGGNDTWTGPVHYTFNTPVGSDPQSQCGRVVFSDFHVENAQSTQGSNFPSECCGDVPMNPQEKVLEYMLFDISACVLGVTQTTTNCTPQTCQQQNFNCGPADDGCGNIIQCGDCDAGTCGSGGQANVCGVINFH